MGKAVPEDTPSICKVHVQSIRELGAAHYSDKEVAAWADGKVPANYVRAMEAGERFFVAEESGELVGFGSIVLEEAEIKAIYVHPSHIKKGIGSRLLHRLERIAKEAGLSILRLNSSLNAVAFYERLGYTREKPIKHKLQSGFEIDCVSMTKKIDKPGETMGQRPTIETERLILRPFQLSDGKEVQRLSGAKEIVSTTLNIPYPYEDGKAEEWISKHQEKFDTGKEVQFAITMKSDGKLISAISLMGISERHSHAEIGFWIGRPYWDKGFCTEAGRSVVRYGFETLGLNRIHANHFPRNPRSGRVLQKLGMKHEGCRRQHVKKWDAFEDVELYGILRSDWEKSKG